MKTVSAFPLQFAILNIESEKKELSGRGRALGRALRVLRQEILAESILAGTTVVGMGIRVLSMTKKSKTKTKTTKAEPKNNRPAKKAEARKAETTTTTTTTTSSTTSSSSALTPPVDLAEVRKDISNIVGANAAALAQAVIGVGLKGQLVPVKYLFEVTGLYPATESSDTKPDKESLARTLMRNLKLPESPIVNEDDEDADSGSTRPSLPEAVPKESVKECVKQPGGADSGTSADGKQSAGECGAGAERAGTIP